MTISLIIPLYNVEKYIIDCLSSVSCQNLVDGEIECIIVDDCGTDNSVNIVKDFIAGYKGQISFSLLHHDKNKGLSEARNTGLRAAKGDYVYFLDSDDKITSDCIEELVQPLKSFEFDFVFANHEVICDWSDMNLTLSIEAGSYNTKEDIINTYHLGWYATAWNKLVRRDLLIDNNLFFEPGILHEDELWSFKLACVARNMYVLNERTYIYYMRSGSIMSDLKSRRHFDSYTKVLEERIKTVRLYGLESNQNLYNIIEDSKLDCMKYANRLLPFKDCRSYYHKLVALHYPNSCRLREMTNKAKLRELQYKMPVDVACLWVLLLNYISDKLVAFRHRKSEF